MPIKRMDVGPMAHNSVSPLRAMARFNPPRMMRGSISIGGRFIGVQSVSGNAG
jgi:hypothetical protein